jgi:AraC-like DNA-binding protein
VNRVDRHQGYCSIGMVIDNSGQVTPPTTGSAGRTHSVLGLAPLLALAKERNTDPERLLARARIPAQLLDDPHARVPIEREMIVVRELLEHTGDPALGIEAGRRYQLSLFGLLGSVAQAVSTVREAIRLFHAHVHLTYTPFATTYVERGEEGWLCFTDDIELGELRRFYLDRDLTFVLETARTLWPVGHEGIARRVELDYPEPPEAARYRDAAPFDIVFGAELAAVVIDPSVSVPARAGQRLALQLLEEHLGAFSHPLDAADFATRVRHAVSIMVSTQRALPDEGAIARSLGMTARTLRRRLSALDTRFRTIADDVLAQLARRHLRSGDLPVATIAERLGYAESASFVRAFTRWTGQTPHAYRTRKVASTT